MTNNVFTPERIAQLRETLAKATQGPWETDTEKTDGEYGSGPDCHSGYHASIITAGDKRICGTENSSDGEVHEEFDEDGCYAWDEVSARNMKAAATAVNTLPAALDEIERLSAERDKAKADAELCAKEWAAEIASGNARLEQLKVMAAELSRVTAERDSASTSLTQAQARIARLEEALKFYSDPSDYAAPQTGYIHGGENNLYFDCGIRARAALKEGA